MNEEDHGLIWQYFLGSIYSEVAVIQWNNTADQLISGEMFHPFHFAALVRSTKTKLDIRQFHLLVCRQVIRNDFKRKKQLIGR